jgi:dCMP deaminase
MTRPSVGEWAMSMAVSTAQRSTCARRLVGCVLLDARNHVMATGYNGVASGQPHCRETKQEPRDYVEIGKTWDNESITQPTHFETVYPNACPGAFAPSGTMLDGCHAIHAEQNALLQCRDVYSIDTCYTTTTPCATCLKLLLGTSCKRIVYFERYPDADKAMELWASSGREWSKLITSKARTRGWLAALDHRTTHRDEPS